MSAVGDGRSGLRRRPDMRATGAIAAIVAGVVLALAGCGDDGDSTDATSGPAPAAGAPAVLPGGGLSVGEAIATDAEPPLAVSGWIVKSGSGARLCSDYDSGRDEPCGEPSLALEGDLMAKDGEQVSVLGAVEGDTFVVSSTVR